MTQLQLNRMTTTPFDNTAKLRALADSLLENRDRRRVYEFLRDAHVDEVAELLSLVEARLPEATATDAVLRLAWLLVETRGIHGADEVRRLDALAAATRDEPSEQATAPSILH